MYSFGLAFIGSILTLFSRKSYLVFLFGFVIFHMGLQGFHCAKGTFTNVFFPEKVKGRVFSLIMIFFPVGAALSSLILNRVLSFKDISSGIMFILYAKCFIVATCLAIIIFGLQNKPDLVVNKFIGEAQWKT